MEQRHVERKLAAILAADVAGYSRLMGADEEGTLAQLKAHRRALVDPKIREHRGKIIKTTGDGMLVEFASVVDAVRCAVEIQRGMGERNAGVPTDRRIEFRNPVPPVSAVQAAPLPLPDKPSIAVLPFTSIGGDAKQERLADGITEDVITDLSRYHDLFVIARNSVFTYKGKAVNVPEVGRELGVRYVLEGSVQTTGDRVRITAQLIEAATNAHVSSDQYDRPLHEFFDLQSEVTQKIAATLGGTSGALTVADAAAIRRKPPANLQAYDYYVLGQQLHYRLTKEDTPKAEEPFKKAIELDPQFARAYSGLGDLYNTLGWFGWGQEEPTALFEKGKALLLKAIALDPTDAYAHKVRGQIYVDFSGYDRAFAEFEKALVLNPNDPDVLIRYGGNLFVVGRSPEGVEMIKRAFRLNPRYPLLYTYFVDPFYVVGQYDRVIATIRSTAGDILPWNYMLLAMSYAQLGRQADMANAVAELQRRDPDFSLERTLSNFGGIPDRPTLALYMDGAGKAGLRDCATQAELQKYPKMTHLAACDGKRATN